MPTYVYKAVDTGEEFEYKQSMKDNALEFWPEDVEGFDPENPKKVVRKIGGNIGVIFNGSGFYQTDYKSSSAPSDSAASCSGPSCASTN